MERFKQILKKGVCLPPLAAILIAIPVFAFLIFVLATDWKNTPVAYAAYVASAYALTVLVAAIPGIVRLIRASFRDSAMIRKLMRYPLGQRVLQDSIFRAELSLYGGLGINLLYAVMKLAMGIYYRSLWFGALAVYYGLLAAMRFFIVRYINWGTVGVSLVSELRRYRICGVILLLMHQALSSL